MDNINEYVSGNTFYLTKRLLGRRYKEATVQDVVGNVSFCEERVRVGSIDGTIQDSSVRTSETGCCAGTGQCCDRVAYIKTR